MQSVLFLLCCLVCSNRPQSSGGNSGHGWDRWIQEIHWVSQTLRHQCRGMEVNVIMRMPNRHSKIMHAALFMLLCWFSTLYPCYVNFYSVSLSLHAGWYTVHTCCRIVTPVVDNYTFPACSCRWLAWEQSGGEGTFRITRVEGSRLISSSLPSSNGRKEKTCYWCL